MPRLPRLAIVVLPGLDHFIHDLASGLRASGRVDVALFPGRTREGLAAALAWADRPGCDAVWFEFCWPPFPALIAATEFGARRVIVRVHRIEAYGTDHVAGTDWSRVDDVIVVGADMARRVIAAAPELAYTSRLHVVHNGVDLDRFAPAGERDPFRIGWCGWLSLHKNPLLALEILHRLRARDPRWHLAVSSKGAEPVVRDAFVHLAGRLGLTDAITSDGAVGAEAIPAWHARNAVLLSTSVYESFGYAIAEAAACGCDLAVLDNAAAAEFWPEATRFGTVEEAVARIEAAAPGRWRALVADRFSLARQVERTLDVVLGPPVRRLAATPAPPAFSSAAYWEQRYRAGGTSGAGSSGRLARFKADTINGLVAEHAIESVIEFGCGDGSQLALARYPRYLGVDVAESALALCRARFASDPGKTFMPLAEAAGRTADLALSLDVVFHLVEPEAFEAHMRALFAAARRLVVIYASDREALSRDAHVRHRAFSDWVARHEPGWRRIVRIANPYPFDPAEPDETSFSDVHVFARVPAQPHVASPAGAPQPTLVPA